jgi:hypothetical protein
MRLQHGAVKLSATDLANHLSCRHLTALDLQLAKGEIAEPSWENPHTRVLQQRGLEHENPDAAFSPEIASVVLCTPILYTRGNFWAHLRKHEITPIRAFPLV